MDIFHTSACLVSRVWVGRLTHLWVSGWDLGCLPGPSTHAPCHCSALYWREEGSMVGWLAQALRVPVGLVYGPGGV